MVTNNMNSSSNNTRHEDCVPRVPGSQCIPWLVVLIAECLAIVILNIITIIVFVKQRQLQRRSTYLIIHLAIVDLLAGAVSGPLHIEFRMAEYCQLWKFDWDLDNSLFRLKSALGFFPVVSLINLAVIALERAHATFCPFRHRFVTKWAYGVIIIVFWLITTGIQATEQLKDFDPLNYYIFYFSCFFIPLVFILVSYVCIFVKVRCTRHPLHHGAAGQRERKLTSTLFLVTLASLLTWLPLVIYQSLFTFQTQLNLSFKSEFHVDMIWQTIYFANSLVNPLIYALRMPELRAGVSQLFHRSPNHVNPVDLPLHNL